MIGPNEPGESLATAREEAGLSIENVASQLHISPRRVVALEENDYEELPEPPYVRGYIRNYAQILDIDPEPLVESYNSILKELNKEKFSSTLPPTDTINIANNEKMIRYTSLAVVIVVTGLLIVWWQSRESTVSKPAFEARDKTEYSADGDLGEVAGEPESAELDTTHFGEKREVSDAESTAASVNEFLANDQNAVKETAQRPGSEAATARSKAITKEQVHTSEVGSATEKTEKPTTPAENSGQGQDEIVLYVQEDSWVDIRDAQDNKLIYKTIGAGQVVTLKGQKPFKVFLGNADGVKLFYNGHEQDVDRFQRGLIARFRLGAQ